MHKQHTPRRRPLPQAALILSLAQLFAPTTQAATPDETAVRAVLMSTWDRPDARLSAEPIVTRGDAALAGWTQGERGGRALLRKTAHGWQVTVCGGDGIKDAKQLQMAGLDAAQAKDLVAALSAAEKRLPSPHVRKFSLFGQNVPVGPDHHAPKDGAAAHGTHGTHATTDATSTHPARPATSGVKH